MRDDKGEGVLRLASRFWKVTELQQCRARLHSPQAAPRDHCTELEKCSLRDSETSGHWNSRTTGNLPRKVRSMEWSQPKREAKYQQPRLKK